jgi:pycsar effector protein
MMIQQDPNNYWEQLERLEKLIRSSELKAGIIFSFHSLILGLFVDRLDLFKDLFNGSIIFIILVIIWIALVLISIFFSFKCFMPRMELKFKKNVFFFKDAANSFGNIEEFSKKLMEISADEGDLFSQLSHQIFIESKIIDQKFKSVQKSIFYFAMSFILIVLIIGFWVVKLSTS